MAYQLRGVIGRISAAQGVANALGSAAVAVPLEQGFALVPYTAAVYDAFVAGRVSERIKPFWWLGESLAELCAQASKDWPLVYVEAEYFGGAGDQKAVLWEAGQVALGPVTTGRLSASGRAPGSTAISQALAGLGVVETSAERDEFLVLGLDRFRHWEDWGGRRSEASGDAAD
ncbi:hypothetical protein KDL01_03225 [Actinospica durhamensis]|uniref:Uncharacterized protein n=1 Tax=Actinospica durhamensis TaxID=1508375 RepID=A0A941EJZ6_9ACTN|nr:hypothetical protein [Actinospica durhamensis]MBR7832253.1 hypothetical protein [Actinospica durhamensis]